MSDLMRAFSIDGRGDAEYLEEAMGVHPPHPTRSFSFCSEQSLVEYMESLHIVKPYYFELEAMCSGPLGNLFSMRRYVLSIKYTLRFPSI